MKPWTAPGGRGRRALVGLAMLALGLEGPPAAAQDPATSARHAPRVLVVGSSAFLAPCGGSPEAFFDLGLRRGFASIGGLCPLTTILSLPERAVVTAVEADVCDSSAVGNIRVTLVRAPRLEASETVEAEESTAGTPGCVTLALAPDPPAEVAGAYLGVTVLLGESTSPEQVTLQGLRVVYHEP